MLSTTAFTHFFEGITCIEFIVYALQFHCCYAVKRKYLGDFVFERVGQILTVKYETNLGENDSSPIYEINYYGC